MEGRIEKTAELDNEKKFALTIDSIYKNFIDKKLHLMTSIQEMHVQKNVLNAALKLKLQSIAENFYHYLTQTSLKEIANLESSYQQKIRSVDNMLQQTKIDMEKHNQTILQEMKVSYVQALQTAASEYRQSIIDKNIKQWPMKFIQFTDEFGAICRINQSIAPYELDFKRGNQNSFGHLHRDKNKVLLLQEPFYLTKLSLTKLTDITNRMIEECDFYNDGKALAYIESNLVKKQFPFLKLIKNGIIISMLKKVVLLKTDEELLYDLAQQSHEKFLKGRKHFDNELKQEGTLLLQKAKNIENIATVSLVHLKNVIEEIFEFTGLYQTAYAKYVTAKDAMQKLHGISEKIFQESKEARDSEVTLQHKAKILFQEIKKNNNENEESFHAIEFLKTKITHYLSLFEGVFLLQMIEDLRTMFLKEFQKYETFKMAHLKLHREYALMEILYSILPLCMSFSADSLNLINNARDLNNKLDGLYQNLRRIEEKKKYSMIHEEGALNEINKDLRVIQEKSKAIQVLKPLADKNFAAIQHTLMQKSVQMYEPIQELMVIVNHQFALVESFSMAEEGIFRRLQICLDRLVNEKSTMKKREDEKNYINELKLFLEEVLVKNFHLWRPTCFSGFDVRMDDSNFRVADGIADMFDANRKFEDPYQWLFRINKIVDDREKMLEKWPYSVFNIRLKERNDFYHALKVHLDSKETNVKPLKDECKKIPKFRS